MTTDRHLQALGRLIDIMQRLRAPDGCPWDAQQTPETLIPYLLEETHETIEALEEGDPRKICDELGDLLLQIVFHSCIFAERGTFDIGDVATAISDKLVRRHPHVFARDDHDGSTDLLAQWERIKAAEKGETAGPASLDASVPKGFPALLRAQKLIEKSARHGRDWPQADRAMEEAGHRLDDFVARRSDAALGELLLAVAVAARSAGLDAEGALRRATVELFRREPAEPQAKNDN